ncbi:MAG TPA: winged helix DNA-binding protein [Alphaproteobacteria bacterium]
MKRLYLEVVALVERLHRQFLEVVRTEIDRMGIRDVNNVQAMILYHIGAEELTVGELTQRGYYLGSNVSYNLKKLIEHGYIQQARSPHDRRSVRIRLTPKGMELHGRLDVVFQQHTGLLEHTSLKEGELMGVAATLRRLEQFWDNRLGAGIYSLTSAA